MLILTKGLDPATGNIQYTNAGHNQGLLVRKDGTLQELPSHGLPLALFPGRPYGSSEFTLEIGDFLCLYTDGVTEAASPDGEEFGLEGLKAFLRTQVGLDLTEVDSALARTLEEHAAGEHFADDRTLLMIRRTGI